ncbi:MAG: FlgD immunoglobulin-like domain containing protein, partial [Gemmatimonadota bacterium]
SSTPTPVMVRVYSLTGVLVRELVREGVAPGEYVVGWDGADRDGRPVPPGVYIAVMTAGSFRGMQRLIVPRR